MLPALLTLLHTRSVIASFAPADPSAVQEVNAVYTLHVLDARQLALAV
jgi:hypothetical protein